MELWAGAQDRDVSCAPRIVAPAPRNSRPATRTGAAETRFDIRIPDDDVAALVTVGDAIGYIERARAAV